MVSEISRGIYGSWKEKQLEKYRDLYSEIEEILEGTDTVLDIGVGEAWLWTWLEEKGHEFQEIKGVDVSKESTEPEKSNINYIYSKDPDIGREFDLVVAFDSIHLINYAEKLPRYTEEDGYILQSLPLKYREKLKRYKDMKVVSKGEIGEEEKDLYLLQEGIKTSV